MTPAAQHPTDRRRGSGPLAWAVLAASVLQVAAPVVTIFGPGSSPGAGSGPDLLITPVGWAFSIWAVIYALAIVQAVAASIGEVEAPSRRLQRDLLVLYLGGTLWIVLAGLGSSLATAAALTLMLVAGVDGALTAVREALVPRWFGVLTRASVGLYAGWVTAAFFLNLSTALVEAGAVQPDELAWQLAVLVAAVVVLLIVAIAVRRTVFYAAGGVWALVGIAVTGATDGTSEVTVVAVTSAAVLVLAVLLLRSSGTHTLSRP